MTLVDEFREPDPLRRAIEIAYSQDEAAAIEALLPGATFDAKADSRIAECAGRLVTQVREERMGGGGLDDFLHEYQLSSREGVILMCLAEALLRIPDAETANRLIRDKFSEADLEAHLGHGDSVFVNASTWALMLTGRVVKLDEGSAENPRTTLRHLVAKSGEPHQPGAGDASRGDRAADCRDLRPKHDDRRFDGSPRTGGSRCRHLGFRQRRSALRVLFLQEEMAAGVIEMLAGAMAELTAGDPGLLATDVGPVIDTKALAPLEIHATRVEREGSLIYQTVLSDACAQGTFFAPVAYLIERMDLLEREVFGPILHVISYAADRLDAVIEAVNGSGYGLTLGIHSRVDSTVRYIQRRLRVGNTYVNRNMIGAEVGVQPFGGEGLSGTGPKAGGPRYLQRFATERTMSVNNTAAAGGNAALVSLGEEELS